MIDKQHGKFIYICDNCGESYETEENDFAAAVSAAKREGWLISRNLADTEWVHSCPDCTTKDID